MPPFAFGFVVVEFDFAFFAPVLVIADTRPFRLAVFIRHYGGFVAVVVPVGPFAVRLAVLKRGGHFLFAVEMPQGKRAVFQLRHELADLLQRRAVGVGIFFARRIIKILYRRMIARRGVFAHISDGSRFVGRPALLVEIDFLRSRPGGGSISGKHGRKQGFIHYFCQ